jgi:hypothetical protein
VTTATSLRTVKPLAFLTALMSIPLLLSYQIKYQRFPEGLPYLFLYFGGLTSVFLTPALLVFERPDTWVTVCTGHIGNTSSPRGGSDALEGVFGYG